MEPVAEVAVSWMVENNHAQDYASLQHHQWVMFSGKVEEQFGLGKERLLCFRAAGKAAGGKHIYWSMGSGQCQHDEKQEQRAITGLIAANKIRSVDHRRKRVDVVKVCLDEGISVVFTCQ